MMEHFHPAATNLKSPAKALISRNTYQVLGHNLEKSEKSIFVICYTPNGSGSGGTGQAIRIAESFNIPIFDLGRYKTPSGF